MVRVLVYGWYHHGNVGDDLFIDAFHHLFPDYQFVFTDTISENDLTDIDAVFFGGGSFLSERPLISSEALSLLLSKKIFYIGVGVESSIHPDHLQLMSHSRMVATRSSEQVAKLQLFCQNVKAIPDLVYSLQDQVAPENRISRSVLIMPNISILPSRSHPYWMHAAWNYFKSEFCQFLDWLVENDYHPTFFPMCKADALDDDWAAAEIIAHMEKRHSKYLQYEKATGVEALQLVSKYEVVLTQRFHGIVLSEMTRTPYMAIHHHDKLKFVSPAEGVFVSYYNSSKQSYIDAFDRTKKMVFTNSLPIESTIFETFAEEVANLI